MSGPAYRTGQPVEPDTPGNVLIGVSLYAVACICVALIFWGLARSTRRPPVRHPKSPDKFDDDAA